MKIILILSANWFYIHTLEAEIMLFEENLKVIQEPSSTITDRNFLFEGKLLRYTNFIQALDSIQGCDMHVNKLSKVYIPWS